MRVHASRGLVFCALAVAVVAVLGGCGSGERQVGAAQARPDWIADPFVDGQFGAVGSASRSLGGAQQALDQATAAARTELARTMSTTIEAAYKTAFTANSDWKRRDDTIDGSEAAKQLSENVSNQVTKEVLKGSRRRAVYTDSATNDVYVWLVVERGQKLSDSIDGKAQAALAEQGLDGMDTSKRITAELEKSFK